MSEWQPIETAPKTREKIRLLQRNPSGDRVGVGHWTSPDCLSKQFQDILCAVTGEVGRSYWFIDEGCGPQEPSWEPTHWMPLPEPPLST